MSYNLSNHNEGVSFIFSFQCSELQLVSKAIKKLTSWSQLKRKTNSEGRKIDARILSFLTLCVFCFLVRWNAKKENLYTSPSWHKGDYLTINLEEQSDIRACWFQQLSLSSIIDHLLSYPRSWDAAIPAVIVWKAGSTLNRSPVYHGADTEMNNHSHTCGQCRMCGWNAE